jgi:hypothetical protein
MRQGTRPRGKLLAPAHLVTAQQSLTAALLKGKLDSPDRIDTGTTRNILSLARLYRSHIRAVSR